MALFARLAWYGFSAADRPGFEAELFRDHTTIIRLSEIRPAQYPAQYQSQDCMM